MVFICLLFFAFDSKLFIYLQFVQLYYKYEN